MSISGWWAEHVITGIDHRSVVERVRADSGWSSHFTFMTLMSAGIAVLGLLLSSPAVVIGAMLISPLMDPIVGLGFGVATFDSGEIRRTALPLIAGSVLAVLFCAVIVAFSPLQSVTSEISSRTRPNLFDLLVALFAGLAGTYAVIRGRHGTIVGVAIATALMPPLAVMGFGLATRNWPVLGGSAFLFFTNLMTIAVSAAVLARVYGFAPELSPHQTRLQVVLILLLMVTFAVPLGISLHRIAWEAVTGREVSDAIAAEFPDGSRISDFNIDFHANPIAVTATMVTPDYRRSANRDLPPTIAGIVGAPVDLSLEQIRTANGADASIPPAGNAASAIQRTASRLAERIAIVAGVPVDNVLVDAAAKRVTVRASTLPGADLSTFRALESRIAASEAGWNIALVPPPLPLPDLNIKDGKPDPQAIQTAAWAGQRLGTPIGVTGDDPESAAVVTMLGEAGAKAVELPHEGRKGRVELRWVVPASTTGD